MKTLLSSLFLLLALQAMGQQYIVYSIQGEVFADGERLKLQQVLTDDSRLSFSTPEDVVYVISPKKGKMVISGGKAVKEKDNEFVAAVKNALLPPTQFRATNTRAELEDPAFEDVYDLKGYFRGNILIIDSTTYQLKGSRLQQDATHYFELHYSQAEGEMNSIRLNNPDILQLRAADFFADPGQMAERKKEVEWFYVNGNPDKQIRISKFTVVQATTEEIVQTLQVLYEAANEEPTPFIYEEAIPFLEMRYGRVQPGQVRRLLQEHLGLKF
ncbi:MAG: hypothetical protein R2824_21280 [Saprospiraceae bacterium]